MNARQKAALYTQLATLARAGVPMHQATAALRPYFHQPEIRQMIQKLEEGCTLSDGMEQGKFKAFEIRMVVTGEQTGRSEHIFQQLAEFWESEADLKSTIQRQCLYPVLLLHLTVLAIPASLLLRSIPRYLGSVALNLIGLYAAVFLLFLLLRWFWNTASGQSLILGLPIIGKTLRAAAAWRWIQVAEIEYSAGIPLPNSIRDAWLATGWIVAESRAQNAEAQLNGGENLSVLYRDWKELPRNWEMFIVTGENAGKLHESLAQLVTEAKRNWDHAQKLLGEWLPRLFYASIMLIVIIQIINSYQNSMAELNKMLDL